MMLNILIIIMKWWWKVSWWLCDDAKYRWGSSWWRSSSDPGDQVWPQTSGHQAPGHCGRGPGLRQVSAGGQIPHPEIHRGISSSGWVDTPWWWPYSDGNKYFVKATLYYKTIDVGDYRIPLEVFDTDRTVINLVTGEILLVVFSITDRSSLLMARSILERVERADGDSSRVLLLGNKMDLDHLREVRK